jgi:hypothetical protein
MLVLDQILDKAGRSLVVPLVVGGRYPGHVGDKVLGFGSYVNKFYQLWHG